MARNIVRYVVAIISIIGEIVCFAFAECDDTICDRFATSHELSLCIGRCRRAFSGHLLLLLQCIGYCSR
ncbi:uncharacterized protein DS421_13g412290 [Arachis hypogaea]|nr:uncharacterized protein DS421_13g412290 [Arachis hypogaea]